jgi:hypothetical protein
MQNQFVAKLCAAALTLPALTAGHAADDRVFEYQLAELPPFGHGVVETLRGTGKQTDISATFPGRPANADYRVISEVGPGFTIIWHQRAGERELVFPYQLRIAKAGFRLPGLAVVGQAALKDLADAFGPAASIAGNQHCYAIPGGPGEDQVCFEIQRGIVQAVTWNWFVD